MLGETIRMKESLRMVNWQRLCRKCDGQVCDLLMFFASCCARGASWAALVLLESV